MKDRERLEPQRVRYAMTALRGAGFAPTLADKTLVTMPYNGSTLRLWPYTGYWACKGIGSGRGLQPLINKLKHNQRFEFEKGETDGR